MRNLKRALSLLLSSTMVLGMVVMGSSAASYADVTSENHEEAIEVLKAVGIMTGDQNGNFNPDQKVTRNEMAVIMSNLMEYNVATYKDTSPFTDVPDWAEPYVAACYTNGITAGISATEYGGDQTVTTAQAALMLMKALGYFKYQSDFGSDWQLATVKQGNAIDLFVGVESGVSASMTRNDVAQLVLNTLESGTVQAETNGSITVGDVTIATDVKYNYVTSNQPYATAIDDARSTSNTTDANRSIVELGEQLYMGDLKLNDKTSDDFERPSRTWSYDGAEIGTYMKNQLVVATYTEGVTGRELYDLLTSATIKEYGFASYLNGGKGSIEKNDLVRSNDDTLNGTGNGVLTQVFLDQDNKEITVTSIDTWLAKANSDYNEDSETLSVKIYDELTDGNEGTTEVLDLADVPEIANVTADQYLLVNRSVKDRTKLEVVAISDPEIVSDATVTKFSTKANSDTQSSLFTSLTADGTEYSASQKALYNEDVLNLYDQGLLTDMSYNVILDPYGYAIGVELYEGALNYVFITGYDRNSSNISVRTADAAAIFLDGTMKDITVNVTDTNKNLDRDGDTAVDAAYDAKYDLWKGSGEYDVNRWYTYTETDGVYTLKPVDENEVLITDYALGASDTKTINCSNVWVEDNANNAGDGTNLTTSGKRGYGNDNSVYITVEPGDVDASQAASKVDGAITDVTGTYTGVQDVDIELTADAQGDVAYNVYTLIDDDQYIIGSIVLGEAQGSTANFAYIVEAPTSEARYEDGVYYWTFDAIMDGKEVELTACDRYQDAITLLSQNEGKVMELRFDENNYVVDADVVTPDVTNFETAMQDAFELFDVDTYTNGYTNDMVNLFLTGRTLHTGDQSTGLTFVTDAPTVLEQQINGKWVTREYASVQDAYNDLADANTSVANLQFQGRIVAVLNDQQVAKWVYIKSDTPINGSDIGYDEANSITNGDVTLAGIVPGAAGQPYAVPKTVRMTSNGAISYSFQLQTTSRANASSVSYTETILVNGSVEQVNSKVESVGSDNMVYGSANVAIDAGDKVEVLISDVSTDTTPDTEFTGSVDYSGVATVWSASYNQTTGKLEIVVDTSSNTIPSGSKIDIPYVIVDDKGAATRGTANDVVVNEAGLATFEVTPNITEGATKLTIRSVTVPLASDAKWAVSYAGAEAAAVDTENSTKTINNAASQTINVVVKAPENAAKVKVNYSYQVGSAAAAGATDSSELTVDAQGYATFAINSINGADTSAGDVVVTVNSITASASYVGVTITGDALNTDKEYTTQVVNGESDDIEFYVNVPNQAATSTVSYTMNGSADLKTETADADGKVTISSGTYTEAVTINIVYVQPETWTIALGEDTIAYGADLSNLILSDTYTADKSSGAEVKVKVDVANDSSHSSDKVKIVFTVENGTVDSLSADDEGQYTVTDDGTIAAAQEEVTLGTIKATGDGPIVIHIISVDYNA